LKRCSIIIPDLNQSLREKELRHIILVRHGATEWAEKHIMQGITDIPLNENGRRQAGAAAKALKSTKVDWIYTSPLSRCQETAELIGKEHGLDPMDAEGLREQYFGWLEGRPVLFFKLQNANAFKKFLLTSWYGLIQLLSGESDQSFRQRVLSTWEHILTEKSQGTIVIVAHILVIRVILEHYFGNSEQNEVGRYFIEPASISEIALDAQGNPKLIRLNDVKHLSEGVG
jgi:broad specificity phosphatase PhoE